MLTFLGYTVSREWESLLVLLREGEDGEDEEEVGGIADKILVVRGLLGIAEEADFGDEIGRRKVFELMRTWCLPGPHSVLTLWQARCSLPYCCPQP